MTQDTAKEAASKKALEFVKDGMCIGLGTGTTSAHFIHLLIDSKRRVKAIATSKESEKMATKGDIPLLDINQVSSLDLTIDGADEIDTQKRLIKGAGGALVREKIIANMSDEMIVIADETKLVDTLGKHLLPIEVVPFGVASTQKELEALGLHGNFRKNDNDAVYLTDNGNWIIDVKLPSPLNMAEELHRRIMTIPGVVDTGFFFDLATRIVIGKNDGSVEIIQ